MHKLKNKHTGEVITTPYMAEVEEYLNSGDYEMIANFYRRQMKKHFSLYEKAVESGDKKKIDYHMKEYLNYQSALKVKDS